MKRLLLVIFIIGATVSNTAAVNIAKQWEKIYIAGASFLDDTYSIQQTIDGGYIVAGTASFDGFRILKLSNNGDIMWEKKYGNFPGAALSIQQTKDNSYIVAGWFGNPVTMDILVLKLDGNGNIVWKKTYGGSGVDGNVTIKQTPDGGYIMAGVTTSFGAGGKDVWLLKLDLEGNIVWEKTYGGSHDDGYGYSEWKCLIQETSDGGYIIAGATSSFGTPSTENVWLIKIDNAGDITWQKTYGGSDRDVANSIQETSDGGYIIAGMTESFGVGSWDAWILKVDAIGNVSWQKTFGTVDPFYTQDGAFSIQQTTDGEYIVACGFDDRKLHILKLDTNGDISWRTCYSAFLSGVFPTIQQVMDGGYIVASMGTHNGADYDFWVLKLGTNGDIPGCDFPDTVDISVSDTFVSSQDSDAIISSTNATVNNWEIIVQDISSQVSTLCTYNDPEDTDADGVTNILLGGDSRSRIFESSLLTDADNCPGTPNGPYLGTCVTGDTFKIGRSCIDDSYCGTEGFCSMNQEDTNGSGMGDACYLCEADFDCDGDCDGTDAGQFKLDFGRSAFDNPCNNESQCHGDFDCDNDCDGTDAAKFKEDFGRSGFNNPCPACAVGIWCNYP